MKNEGEIRIEDRCSARLAAFARIDSPDGNLRLLKELDAARDKIVRYYLAHPERLESADENVRRCFRIEPKKHGSWL